MIETILPLAVAVAEARPTGDAPLEACLFAEERAAVANAIPSRRAEFGVGRCCARQALGRLGAPAVPIPSGPNREPLWPDGFVGSITHCGGYCAAAVARGAEFRTLGIDAEPDEPLPAGVLAEIALPGEATEIALPGEASEIATSASATSASGNRDRLLFCAKEAVYKAWFPLARCWLGFEEASITFEPDGRFIARLLVPGPVAAFDGRWTARDGLLLTAVALPA